MAIRTENDEILDVGAVELNGAVYEIVEPHGAVGDFEPNRTWCAVALTRGDFIRGSTSVSSIRGTTTPPRRRAKSQWKSAVRAPPTCRYPVGDGAKRTRGAGIGES